MGLQVVLVDELPMEFHCDLQTLGSFPHCKWDCKWCWWRSCRWSFEGSLARNAFLRDSRCTKPYVFPYKVRPRTSMIYLCGATGARRSRVWSDHARIMVGSVSDRFSIVNMGCHLCFVHLRSTEFHCDLQLLDRSRNVNGIASGAGGWVCRWNSIVICNSRIVPSL